MTKLLALFAVLVFSLILLQSVLAYQYYIRPPKMILYTNVTRAEPGTFSGFLEIRNYNNKTMNVTFNVSDELRDIITVQYPFVVLQPNETMIWNFTGEVYKTGRYQGKISPLYGIDGFQLVNLDSKIIIIASGEDVVKFPVVPLIIGLVSVVVLIALGFLLIRKK